jgi:hypothetical protein
VIANSRANGYCPEIDARQRKPPMLAAVLPRDGVHGCCWNRRNPCLRDRPAVTHGPPARLITLRPLRGSQTRCLRLWYCSLADLGPQPYHRGLIPTATFCARLYRLPELERPHALVDAPRIALYPTGRLYLYRFSPVPSLCTITAWLAGVYTFNSGASHLPPARLARCGYLAVDGVNYTRLARRCQYLCDHTPLIPRHTHTPAWRSRGNHAPPRPRADQLLTYQRTDSHSRLTII